MLYLIPILLCLTVGAVLLAHSFRKPSAHRSLVYILTLATLLVSAGIVVSACLCSPAAVTLFYLPDSIPVALFADDLSKFFILTVTVIWVLVAFYSKVYMHHEGDEARFYGFYLLLYGMLVGLNFAANLVTFYLFFELMTLVSFPLVLHNKSKEAIMASLKYLFYSVCGAYMGLYGIFILQSKMGDLSFVAGGHLDSAVFAANEGVILTAVFLMIIGFGAKAGMFPLHAWLPSAHPVAPSPASAVLSGIIVKGGVLAIVRILFYVLSPSLLAGTWVMTVLMSLSLLTVFMGSLLAFREKVFKKRLAYSTVSQVSYILFGLFVLTPDGFDGALLHVLFHAIVKTGLFLTAGIFIVQFGITRVEDLKGMGKRMPIALWCYTIFALSLIGIPPTSGFISKWYLCIGALEGNVGIFRYLGPAILLVSALLTAGYLLPITMKGFFPGKEADVTYEKKEPPLWMLIPLVVLAALALLCGIFPGPVTDFAGSIAATIF